jgi:hypothetical protein
MFTALVNNAKAASAAMPEPEAESAVRTPAALTVDLETESDESATEKRLRIARDLVTTLEAKQASFKLKCKWGRGCQKNRMLTNICVHH